MKTELDKTNKRYLEKNRVKIKFSIERLEDKKTQGRIRNQPRQSDWHPRNYDKTTTSA